MLRVTDILFFSAPIIAVMLISVIFECIRPERPDTMTGRLPVMILLLIPLTVLGLVLFYGMERMVTVLTYETSLKRIFRNAWLAELALSAFLMQLIARLIAKKRKLTRKNRIISLILMLVFWLSEIAACFYA